MTPSNDRRCVDDKDEAARMFFKTIIKDGMTIDGCSLRDSWRRLTRPAGKAESESRELSGALCVDRFPRKIPVDPQEKRLLSPKI
jgi:hypothetical protein